MKVRQKEYQDTNVHEAALERMGMSLDEAKIVYGKKPKYYG